MQQSSHFDSDASDETMSRGDEIYAFYRALVLTLDGDVRRALETSVASMSRSQALLAKLEQKKD